MGETINGRPPQAGGGVEGLGAIMAEHEAMLLRYAAHILNDPDTAQDVVQDAFIRLCKWLQQGWQPQGEVKTWLYRVTHNLAVDHIRRESRLRLLHARQAETVPPVEPDSQCDEMQRSESMALALAQARKLPAGEQQVVLLRLQQGLSYKEIAIITGRTEGNIGCILHHAVKKIAAGLKKAGAI